MVCGGTQAVQVAATLCAADCLAGGLKLTCLGSKPSSRVITAHRMRAFLLAMATQAFYKDFPLGQDLNWISLLAAFLIAIRSSDDGREKLQGATENRLHIYKRSCCTRRCGPRYEPLSRAPFVPRGWARLPPRRVSRVHQLPV